MSNFNGITIGALPVYDPPTGAAQEINFFEMHTGSARWGWGAFLMQQPDYVKLQAGPAIVPLNMSSATTAQIVSFNVVIVGYEPYSTAVSSNRDTVVNGDMVAVIVRDTRSNNYGGLNKQINLQVQGFPLTNTSGPVCYNTSMFQMSIGTLYTWSTLFAAAFEFGNSNVSNASLPTTWQPRNMIFNNIPKSKAIDIAADKIFQIVGFDGSNISLYDVGNLSPANQKLIGTGNQMGNYAIGGGSGSNNSVARLPNNLEVTFPRYDTTASATNPSDASQGNHIETIATAFKGQYSLPLSFGDYWAITSNNGMPANETELATVATDLTARWSKRNSQNPSEQVYAGIWPVFPDGKVWGVRWSSVPAGFGGGNGGATTTVRCFDDAAFSGGDGWRQMAMDLRLVGNQTATIVGQNYAGPDFLAAAATASNTPSGTLFAVNVNQSGGSNGTDALVASYTYLVYSLAGPQIGSMAFSPIWARTVGLVYAATHGTGYYDSMSAFHLYQVDEVPETIICASS